MTVAEYLSHLNRLFITGHAREHAYRGDLQILLSSILPDILVTNEPARVSCGAPDYMLSRKDVPIGYIEAKDIGVDLASKNLKEQFDRYKAGLTNLIITDYLNFQFYKDGDFVTEISIGKLENHQIVPQPENFSQFTHLIEDFAQQVSQSIKSPTRLAKMMAGKAKLMADVIEKSLNSDDENDSRSNLKSQMISFKQMLIHDINNRSFADIYAQTIAYGMFAARYHDPTLPTFSRMEAAQLIPKSNSFLRKLFQDIAGFDLDDRLVWIVDELVQIFLASDVATIMKNFGKATKQEDPVVHFYETFLGEYNPALRKARGVWYTPQPVVNFIVRAVDDILKTEFNLPQGLADTSKTKIKIKVPTDDARFSGGMRDYEQEVHKVQILDPATGTGTFLAEVVRLIYKKFEGQQGIWSKYVSKDLIPRLNGFELLMASYAMAHLKMDMLLTETGYKPVDEQRLRIFLTNSLEEAYPDTGTLFSSWLSDEADQANAIKRDTPVMCVIGNPPYAVSSSNKGDWIQSLLYDYKKDLNERKINLDDDYIKFTRYGQYFIDKNGEGILAFISNNSFIDGITHRQMRKSLLESFDKIFILDLHGHSKKKETAPDGSVDQNVFDIMQGVSINLFIKTGKKEKGKFGEIFHADLFGKRENKYFKLLENQFYTIQWNRINNISPYYFFVPKDFSIETEYSKGFRIDKLFPKYSNGVETKCDALSIHFNNTDLKKVLDDFNDLEVKDLKLLYNEKKDSSGWSFEKAKLSLQNDKYITQEIQYRPFDYRKTVISPNSGGFIGRSRYDVMRHFLYDNVGLIVPRQTTQEYRHNFITDCIVEGNITASAKLFGTGCIFPLYLYPETSDQQTTDNQQPKRIPNLNPKILLDIEKRLNLTFLPEKEEGNVCMANSAEVRPDFRTTFTPLDLLDYIYAVLHSPAYREKYKEFLKIDFPRVPYPGSLFPEGGTNETQEKFWALVKLGGELRQLHLLESAEVENYITQYPIDGDNVVTRKMTNSSPGFEPENATHGKVWINDSQYFENVPLVAWEFYIGGYQPAQKWLKDRKGRELSFEDILHYQKMMVALSETDRLMKEIDEVGVVGEEIKES